MEQVAAKQRMKVAARDHILISKLHIKLHNKLNSENLPYVIVALFVLEIAILVVAGIMQQGGH